MPRKRIYNLSIPSLSVLAISFLLLGCAITPINDVDNYSRPIKPGNGILVIAVDSMIPFSDLRLARPDDTFAAIATRLIPVGRTIRFVELPAGDYQWTTVDLGSGWGHVYVALDRNKKEKYTFSVKPGVVNYPGDFIVTLDDSELAQFVYSHYASYETVMRLLNRYYMQLTDRDAMLMGDLSADQMQMVNRLGLVYTGPGSDEFPQYYKSLLGTAGKTR